MKGSFQKASETEKLLQISLLMKKINIKKRKKKMDHL